MQERRRSDPFHVYLYNSFLFYGKDIRFCFFDFSLISFRGTSIVIIMPGVSFPSCIRVQTFFIGMAVPLANSHTQKGYSMDKITVRYQNGDTIERNYPDDPVEWNAVEEIEIDPADIKPGTMADLCLDIMARFADQQEKAAV